MTQSTISSLLKKAETHALAGEWQSTIETLEKVLQLDPMHSGANRTIGTLLLQTGDPAGAIHYLQTCTAATPDDEDARMNLARALARSGRVSESEQNLLLLLDRNPENREALNLLAQTLIIQDSRVIEAVQILAALVQSDPTDPEALYLMGRVYESAEDYESASDLYKQILLHHPDDQRASAALKELESAPGREPLPSVLFLGPPVSSTQDRLGLPAKALSEDGYPVQIGTSWNRSNPQACDVVVMSQPHTRIEFIEAFLYYKEAGKKVYVDLDMHYPSIPEGHRLYETAGPGNPDGLEALEQILDSADGLLVSSQALGEACEAPGREIHVFPPVWDPDNPLWHKPAEKREEIHLGLVGSQVQLDDAKILVPVLEELFEKYDNLKLVVLENFALLDLFDGIDEHRKLFLPASRYEDYPYQLSYIDILLVPGEDTPFNRTRSDRPLMEAGIRGIPWVASGYKSDPETGVGGFLVWNNKDWLEAIKQLLSLPNMRNQLGSDAKEVTQARELSSSTNQWARVLNYYQ